MKTKNIELGELVALDGTINSTKNGGKRVANIDPMFVYSAEDRKEIAKRIVKAVNMHDELIHTSKLLADFASKVLAYPKGENGYDPADKINLNNQIEKMDKLLKQASSNP